MLAPTSLEPTTPSVPQEPPSMATLPQQTPVDGQPMEDSSIVEELEAHLNQLQDNDKAFLAEHLTPEFVRAIGLINGPEVAQYLNQFVDPDKVLVPVPRQIAEQYMAEQKNQPQPSAPQGQPAPNPQAMPQAQPQGGGMMTPKL